MEKTSLPEESIPKSLCDDFIVRASFTQIAIYS